MAGDLSNVTVAEFTHRLTTLCLQSRGSALPRRRRDRHIVLRSVVLTLDPDTRYRETEVNVRLEEWLAGVGSGFVIDHVSLRRELVDMGYLVRDAAGTGYRVAAGERAAIHFDSGVARIDPVALVAAAQEEREQRRKKHLPSSRQRPG